MTKVKKTQTKKNGKRPKQPLYPTQRGPAPSGIGQRGGTPLARHARLVSGVPKRGYHAAGETISNCEFVGDATINCDAATLGELFQTKSYRINAGDRTTFPWLSVVAEGYEYYKFESLEFIFISREPATKEGVILMVIDTDPSDPRPSNSQELMVSPRAATDVVWTDLSCTAPPAALNNFVANGGHGYYVSNGNDAQGSDLRLIDSGTFWFASDGYQHTLPALAAKTVGSLLVRYRVKLSIPNSEKRLVENGTQAAPITQPAPLLPEISRVYDTRAAVPPAYVNATWSRILLDNVSSLPSAVASIANFLGVSEKDMTMRNAAQYFDVVKQNFIMPKGKWKVDASTTNLIGGPTATATIEKFLRWAAYRPSTGQTVYLDCTRNTQDVPIAGTTLYDTIVTSAIATLEEGDELFPEFKYNALIGTDPTGKIFRSVTDPTYVTMTQLGL
jgi:hypothetical protein